MIKQIEKYLLKENKKAKESLFLKTIFGCKNCIITKKNNISNISYCKTCLSILRDPIIPKLTKDEILKRTGVSINLNI